MLKRWTVIFKAMANLNRLKIISILAEAQRGMIVSELAKEIDISLKSTSKHLIILKNLEILDSLGKDGHVRYFINSRVPQDARKAMALFVKIKTYM